MISQRVYVEKKHGFNLEAKDLLVDFNSNLNLQIKDLRVLNVYDLINIEANKIELYVKEVLSEPVTDTFCYEINLEDKLYFATEYLPGQFDQRAQSAMQCMSLVDENYNGEVVSGKLFIFEGITNNELTVIKNYFINSVESREKDLSKIGTKLDVSITHVCAIKNFIFMDNEELITLLNNYSLAMNINDLVFIQDYFKNEKRDITETELLLLDTYWSDHCRHTTFETQLNNIKISQSSLKSKVEEIFNNYLEMRNKLGRNDKPITLMDMATICAKYQRSLGILDNLEVSEEVNASSIFINVDVDGKDEKWLLMLKNETHNHPTEIEPFGGASTCVGGAIRDPLSGRSYVYQAMRISGSGNPFENVSDTLKYKLPQRTISKVSANGYSSYGNQIGLTTTYVREIVDRSYVAKHLEVGAVVGAVKACNIKREEPQVGDVIILLGGRTGRDGIGGATGSSKEHDEDSLEKLGAQVQKGNANEERKIQRFFRNKNVTRMIKRCNDFGAGGVAVSIGEIARSIEINLDQVELKYQGLSGTEITLSESQERMSVVVLESDANKFIKYAAEENIEAKIVAKVTDDNRLKIVWNKQVIVDISRDFIDTNGIRRESDVEVEFGNTRNVFTSEVSDIKEKLYDLLEDDNVACQKGLVEMFDSTIGASTVLMPFGGKNFLTPSQVGVQKVPVLNGTTDTCSILSYGFNPKIAKESSFHSAMYAVIESITKVVACGGSLSQTRLSFQEYFEKLGNDPKKWGKPFQALLGALYVQDQLQVAAIGGKDSMSGTFQNIDVIPTLISFALCPGKSSNIISPEFKSINNYIYVFKHDRLSDDIPNFKQLKNIYSKVETLIREKIVISAYAVEYGIAEGLVKMSFGNDICVNVKTDLNLFDLDYGTIIVESTFRIDDENAILIGNTSNEMIINGVTFNINDLKRHWLNRYNKLFKIVSNEKSNVIDMTVNSKYNKTLNEKANAFIPVFPGTNCEYDMQRAFNDVGIDTTIFVFKNQNVEDVKYSIDKMVESITNSNIIALSGGFSAADEPDGSGKYIASILKNKKIRDAIELFLDRGGLIIGICNGFQALVKCGLLPYGKYGMVDENSPTLFKNKISRHLSQFVNTKVMSNSSPWTSGFDVGEVHRVPISHGEGQFIVSSELAKQLFENGQVAFCYCDENGNVTGESKSNPNDSAFAIEGVTSPCGQIIGKMAHSERYGENLYKNIAGVCKQKLFENGASYFTGGSNDE